MLAIDSAKLKTPTTLILVLATLLTIIGAIVADEPTVTLTLPLLYIPSQTLHNLLNLAFTFFFSNRRDATVTVKRDGASLTPPDALPRSPTGT